MYINRSIEYAFLAVEYLARHTDEGPVKSSKIAKECGIPPAYLLLLLVKLAKGNILKSKSRQKGGYSLARPAKEISLLEIIEAVDGPITSKLKIVQKAKKAKFIVNMEKVHREACEKAISILGKARLVEMMGG